MKTGSLTCASTLYGVKHAAQLHQCKGEKASIACLAVRQFSSNMHLLAQPQLEVQPHPCQACTAVSARRPRKKNAASKNMRF